MTEEWEVVSKYTSEQATEDGFLCELAVFEPSIKGISQGPFSHVTTNLLYKGEYLKRLDNGEETMNLPNILDLLNQALAIFKRGKQGDWFYSGFIELPSGARQEIFIGLNETGKFTIMLPEDY